MRDPWGNRLAVAFFVALTAHTLLVASQHRAGVLADLPATWGDHACLQFHATTELRVARETGSRWGYDPRILAGYPRVAAATDSHAMHATVRALAGLGVSRAYALWAIAAVALTPVLLVLAARAASGAPGDGWLAGLATLALLHLDALARPMWRWGMVAWLLACAVTALFATVFAALLHEPSRRRLAAALLLQPLLAAHVLAPATVAVTFVLVLGHRLRRDGPGRGEALRLGALVGLFSLLVNSWWVVPLVRHLWITGSNAEALNVPWTQAPLDLASALVPYLGYQGGALGLRWALIAGALWLGARGEDARARPLAACVAAWLLLAYLGGETAATAALQSHRFVIIAAFLGAAFAGPALRLGVGAWRAGGRRRAWAALLALSASVSIVCEVRSALERPLHPHSLGREELALVNTLRAAPPGDGRLLVEFMANRPSLAPALTVLLPDHAFVTLGGAGGLLGDYGRTAWSNFPQSFLGRDPGAVRPDEVPALLERYAVSHVVARSAFGRDLMERAPAGTFSTTHDFGPWRVYELARKAGWFLEGTGELAFTPGRLTLTSLDGPVTLRFHHVDGLRALEGRDVRVAPAPVDGDPVPFIRVDPAGRRTVTLVYDG